MKTAVSIPDPIFETADRLARRLGISRSNLYARAVAEFVEGHRHRGVTEGLNDVYSADPDASALDPKIETLQAASLPVDDW